MPLSTIRSYATARRSRVVAVVTLIMAGPGSRMPSAQAPAAIIRPEIVLQTGHTAPVNAFALSADGRFLVSGSDDNTLKVWDTANGFVLRTLAGHEKAVLSVAISNDNRLIVSGGEDGSVRTWDVVTGVPRFLGRHAGPVQDVAFSDDSRTVTSLGALDLKQWNAADGRELRATVLIPDKERFMAAGQQLETALTRNGRLAAITGGVTFRAGVFGIGGGIKARPIRIVDSGTGRDLDTFKVEGELPLSTGLLFSPDGRFLVSSALQAAGRAGFQGTATVYEVATGRVLKTFPAESALGGGGVAFNPDSSILALRRDAAPGAGPDSSNEAALQRYGSGASITLFDVRTWTPIRELSETAGDFAVGGDDFRGIAARLRNDVRDLAVAPMAFSNDGKRLAATAGQGIALFDVGTGNRLRVLQTTARTSAIAAAPTNQPSIDEQQLKAAGLDAFRQSIASMASVRTAAPGEQRLLASSPIAFSADGKQLVASEANTAWELIGGTPRPRSVLARAAFSRFAVEAVSPDGMLSASAGVDDDGTVVLIRKAATNELVRRIVIGKSSTPVRMPKGMPFPLPPAVSEQMAVHRIAQLAFNASGVVVLYCDLNGFQKQQECYLRTFNPVTGQQVRELRLDADQFNALGELATLSPAGRFWVRLDPENPKITGGGGFAGRFGIGVRGGAAPEISQPYKVIGTDVQSRRKAWEIKATTAGYRSNPVLAFGTGDAVVAVSTVEQNRQIVRLHDTASGRPLASLDIGDGIVGGLFFSRDNRRIAVMFDSARDREAAIQSAFQAAASAAADQRVGVYDATTGRRLFVLAHDAGVDGIAFSPNGELIATLGRDQTEFIWDANTGARLATLFSLDTLPNTSDTPDWLVVTPEGLFDGSPAAWQQIAWRFSQNTFDIGTVETFFNELYYPGLASEIFAGRPPKAPRDLQQIDRRQPTLEVTVPITGEVATRQITVKIDVTEAPADSSHAQGSGARDVRLFRNGTLVKLWPGDVLNGGARTTLEATLPIVAGANRITAYAFNRENVKSPDTSALVNGSAGLARKGTAYVLALGINRYENSEYDLKFATADATTFAEELRNQQERLGLFERVEVVTLLDQYATKANLLLALRRLAGGEAVPAGAPPAFSRLAQAQPEDAVIIYFAGHGTALGSRFYLVPHDLGYTGARKDVNAGAIDTILTHSISDLEIEDAVRGLDASQLVMVIDACNSGQALEAEEKRRGPMNSKGLAQLAYEKGMYILTAAQSYQAALETSQLGHGYLTFTLVEEGLKKGLADVGQKDGLVLVREWFDYASARVPELQQGTEGSRLLLQQDDQSPDPDRVRNLQSPRAFYRRDAEATRVIIAKK